jgi:mRNA interferase YafQ
MYCIKYTNKFKKDIKRCQRRGRDLNLLRDVVDMLAQRCKMTLI